MFIYTLWRIYTGVTVLHHFRFFIPLMWGQYIMYVLSPSSVIFKCTPILSISSFTQFIQTSVPVIPHVCQLSCSSLFFVIMFIIPSHYMAIQDNLFIFNLLIVRAISTLPWYTCFRHYQFAWHNTSISNTRISVACNCLSSAHSDPYKTQRWQW